MKSKKLSMYIGLLSAWLTMVSMSCLAKTHTSAQKMLNQAVTHRKAGEYSQAISLLTSLRETFIGHKRINIELALNYIKLRQYDRAEQLVTYLESLELSDSEHAVISKLKRVLTLQLRRSLAPHTLYFTSNTSVGIDIVQNSFPVYTFDDTVQDSEYWSSDEELNDSWIDSEFIYTDYAIDEQLFGREEISNKNEVGYVSQALSANYRYRPVDMLAWFSYPTQWIIDTDVQVKYKQLDKSDNNKYLSYHFDTSAYLLQINRWLLELNAYAKVDYVDNHKLINKSRLRLAWTLPFESSKLKFSYDVEQKHYRSALQDYNATVHVPAIEYTYVFSSQWRLSFASKYYRLNAHDDYNSYRNTHTSGALYYNPHRDIVTYISYNHYVLKYEISDPELVAWSRETKRTLSIGFKYQANEKLALLLLGNLGDNRIEMGLGDDSWQRLEASIEYRF
ncbi:hypothetical protein PA25_17610 [Pseudoalteromonas sp. A25]|uniref:tetratricopeptide repeat protein n=1 Tax=Pseudoalteromonas sp. A25 TaxID=116092 RepID=UPI0012611333|nr:tetratricopeptide repeat protein [Pseudoalteromonas sp. A25]BBN81776.1 hypothetical protein PA25_17610 [Pseudoalteromonas sp. A25]